MRRTPEAAAERFARAVERGPVRGLRRGPAPDAVAAADDADGIDDLADLVLVADRLRAVVLPGPSAQFRLALRQRLAETGRPAPRRADGPRLSAVVPAGDRTRDHRPVDGRDHDRRSGAAAGATVRPSLPPPGPRPPGARPVAPR